jgi:GDP-L-fucose synthase
MKFTVLFGGLQHLTLTGSTSEFLYSTDAALGIVMGTQDYNDPEPVNLGTGYEISIRDLIALICELMEFEGEIVYETDQPNGQPRRCLNTQRVRQSFGFTAQVDFRQGLKNTIDWYRQYAGLEKFDGLSAKVSL